MKNKNKSKKIQKFIQQQTGKNGLNRNQEQEKMYAEKKAKLKKEQAAILGYQTYAEVSIERKMAESVTAAAQFSAQLWAQRCAQFSGAILRRPRPAPP